MNEDGPRIVVMRVGRESADSDDDGGRFRVTWAYQDWLFIGSAMLGALLLKGCFVAAIQMLLVR